uniref:Putative secreted protein n=1 Tax=Ixodes ricinus TaxID=34613 RepID=A0A6B0UMB1_IXORI
MPSALGSVGTAWLWFVPRGITRSATWPVAFASSAMSPSPPLTPSKDTGCNGSSCWTGTCTTATERSTRSTATRGCCTCRSTGTITACSFPVPPTLTTAPLAKGMGGASTSTLPGTRTA